MVHLNQRRLRTGSTCLPTTEYEAYPMRRHLVAENTIWNRGELRGLEHLFLNLLDEAAKLIQLQAHSVLPVSGLFSGHVPVRHPAELLAVAGLKHDQKRIKSDLLLAFAQPRLQLSRKQGGDHLEISVSGSQLKIEIHVHIAHASARRTGLRSPLGKVVQALEQLLVRRVFLMT